VKEGDGGFCEAANRMSIEIIAAIDYSNLITRYFLYKTLTHQAPQAPVLAPPP